MLDVRQILFSLGKTGSDSPPTPAAYVGRVTGSRINGLVIFTIHDLKTDDTGYYCCTMIPLPPNNRKTDHVWLVVEGEYGNANLNWYFNIATTLEI